MLHSNHGYYLITIIVAYTLTNVFLALDKTKHTCKYWLIWTIYTVAMGGCIIYLIRTS